MVAVGLFYLLGMWEHLPFSGGHIYSDIVTVYQNRFCYSGPCGNRPPLRELLCASTRSLLAFSCTRWECSATSSRCPEGTFLEVTMRTLRSFYSSRQVLLVDNLRQIMEILGIGQKSKRTLLFLVATPSFVFMLLLNWYIIGVFFAIFGLRKFLEGIRSGKNNSMLSGILLGLSAAANLITAVPALGILIFGTTSGRSG